MQRSDRPLYAQLLSHLRNAPSAMHNQRLMSCVARTGETPGECLCVGIAANGGAKREFTIAGLTDESMPSFLDDWYAEATAADPLRWVDDRKSKHFRRPFFQASKAVITRLWPEDDPHNKMIWSNLYKVSPAAGGNPDRWLRQLQQAICCEILVAEIKQWQPRYVVFFTNRRVGPFLDRLGWSFSGDMKKLAVGQSPQGIRFTVSPHPLSLIFKKRLEPTIEAISQHLDR